MPDHALSEINTCPAGDAMEAWKARGRELNEIYDAIARVVCAFGLTPTPDDALADLKRLESLTTIERLAQHLAAEDRPSRCEVVADNGHDRCSGRADALRWEFGFADWVCEHHAVTASEREGAVVIWPHRHDGTESPVRDD